jgi:hypothetical protein
MSFEINDLKQSYVIEVTSFTTIDLATADNALKSQLSLTDSVITLKPVYSIVFRDSNGNAVSSPVNPGASITVYFYYSTAFKNALGNQETNLTVYKYNPQQNKWVEVVGSPYVDTNQRSVKMELSEFSVFTLAPKGGGGGGQQTPAGEIKAYPNPVTKSDTQMTIIVPQGGSFELYNANAELVVTLTDDDNDGVISWNLKNKDDKDVVSGVYIGIVKDADKKKQATVKIAVIK